LTRRMHTPRRIRLTRRRLDVELVRRHLAESRTEAQRAIHAGLVRVGTNTAPKASTLVSPSESVHLVGAPEPFVSRGGRKLDGALSEFSVDVSGMRAVDVGASTGGFTDCLLQQGVASVVAVDVGYGQMHWRVREDPRVTVVERTNIRTATVDEVGTGYDLVVADLSFISLTTVADAIEALGNAGAQWLLLVKPQFEAGRNDVGKGGIVRDVGVRIGALRSAIRGLEATGLGCRGIVVSSITGATGNVEFMTRFTRQASVYDDEAIAAVGNGTPT
jgi:23S rRNA (cytidine1920-2'-O)/16S rRNA (cytidine1409-2'-O)-methyltransferase